MLLESNSDHYDLARFVTAQAMSYAQALSELRSGQKKSHWIWFIFPQCASLGSSPRSVRFAIRSRSEAVAYLEHPVLGTRLRETFEAAMFTTNRSAHEIFGSPDDAKTQSCATLFDAIEPGSVFDRALEHFFEGVRDARTIAWLIANSAATAGHR
ncbi:MAG: DUF1810 domain-containing protein [Gemmatimonadaceae bacterium]